MSIERLYKYIDAPAQEDLCEKIELELRTLEHQYGTVTIITISHDITQTVLGSYIYSALIVVQIYLEETDGTEETNS